MCKACSLKCSDKSCKTLNNDLYWLAYKLTWQCLGVLKKWLLWLTYICFHRTEYLLNLHSGFLWRRRYKTFIFFCTRLPNIFLWNSRPYKWWQSEVIINTFFLGKNIYTMNSLPSESFFRSKIILKFCKSFNNWLRIF